MGYSIAYNSGTTTPFGTYKQGGITMGLKPQEYTVSSGFTWYANAETPNDNYLIISDTYSQGWSTQAESKPTIWRSETGTTESFVSLVNQLPDVNGVTGFTDGGTAMKYLMDSGKYFVNKDNYLGIVTDGLVLNLDAGWYPSYSGSGTTWKDIKDSNNGTLTNGPTFSTDGGGCIVFDGVDDYVDGNFTSNLTGILNVTACAWVNIISNTGGSAIINRYFNNTQFNGWALFGGGTSEPIRFGFGGRESSSQFISITSDYKFYFNTWYYVVGVKEGNIWKIYVDGVLENSQQVGNGTTVFAVNKTFLASYPQFGEPPNRNNNIKISNSQIYNRALSADEVLQNYNAQKGRFGL